MAIDRRPNRPKPWRADYWGPDGRQHSRSFERKTEAQRWLAEVEHDKTRGHWTNPALGRVRFSAWVGEWHEMTNNVRPTTVVRDRMLLDRYLLPRFGPLPLAGIGQRDVRAWVTELTSAFHEAWVAPVEAYRRVSCDALAAHQQLGCFAGRGRWQRGRLPGGDRGPRGHASWAGPPDRARRGSAWRLGAQRQRA
jgi:Phage integrase, N-terminal SAM-like domain